MSINQTASIISTYTSDISGVCSALFELGGMTVMHDASGCNSTYNTHDEPRWYDINSLVFISGLTETDAILGNDEKLVKDTIEAAKEFKPRFICLAGSPIPMLTGIDLAATGRLIERATGITTFAVQTTGMHSYIYGANMAFSAVANRLCRQTTAKRAELTANIIGVTPLDFSVNGSAEALRNALNQRGVRVNSVWAMGGDPDILFDDIAASGEASVNLVVSACGYAAAIALYERFGIPYVVGTPYGETFTNRLVKALQDAAFTGESKVVCKSKVESSTVIIGESVTAMSLANALFLETGVGAKVLCPVDHAQYSGESTCINAWDEDDIKPYLQEAKIIIADPLYRPISPPEAKFIELPHEAFSGRIYRQQIPELITGLGEFINTNPHLQTHLSANQ